MSEYNDTVLTNAGLDLAKRAFKGSTSFTITRIMSTTDTIVTGDIPAMTKLTTENQKATILNQNNDSGSLQALGVNAQFDNQNLNAAYNIKAVGVYAKENKSGASEVLYAVTTAKTAENMPVFNGSVIFTFQIAIYFVVGRTDNVTITYDPDGYATIDYVDNALANINLTDYVKLAQYNTDMAALNNALGTKVNTADMRKPASDVAGIEEVNAKQDKIGYTPADDSKVVHSTITQLNSTDMNTVLTAGFYQLISGTNGMPNADWITIYQVIPVDGTNGVQLAYGTNNTILGMRSWNESGGFNFTSWVQFADDSKVAHLSGTNNFDTVPTVNNNPLLLASSLPTDLARTSQPANFTDGLQKSGKDVATTADVTSATTAANAYTDSKIKSSSNTGWQIITGVNSGKYNGIYRILNGVLYATGYIIYTGTNDYCLKLDPSWKLPDLPLTQFSVYGSNIVRAIINQSNAKDNNYLITCEGSANEMGSAYFSFSLPII